MKKIHLMTLLLIVAVSSLSGCYVRPAGVHARGSVVIHDRPVSVGIHFSDDDRHHVHSYYTERYRHRHKEKRGHGRGKGLPPGLAKRDRLPPGLAKRDRLPPGLSGERLPRTLERRLSPLPAGVIRLRIGTDLVLMDERSRVVLDVMKDIPIE